MAYEIVMPRLGWTMEEGIFVEWLKKDGDAVQVGDLVCAVEGDKAINEIESFESGILRIPSDAPLPGATVKVGALLGYIAAVGEKLPTPNSQLSTSKSQQTVTGVPSPISNVQRPTSNLQPPTTQPPNHPTISPRARRIASELGVAWTMLAGSGRTGRIVERDVRAAAMLKATAQPAQPQPTGELRVSPLARRRAEELGVDLTTMAAAQPGKRIEVADVEAARVGAGSPRPYEEATPMTNVRRLIAERMATSAHTTAAVTLTTEVDATELVRLRKEIAADLKDANISAPSYNDLLAKLVAVALREHPALNATLAGDAITQHDAVHVGLAVDTERGLLVPVVRDAQAKSVQQIAAESSRLIGQVRANKIASDDLRGGTFTITNLGMYEIDAFTPIINLPECAILGVGRIVAKQVVMDDETETVAIRKMMALSLTFDHRIVDGGPAARFLQRVKQFVEHPYLWLTR